MQTICSDQNSYEKAKHAIQNTLKYFIGPNQLEALGDLCHGEEGQHFLGLLINLNDAIANMPKVGEQDGKRDMAMVYLHYFTSQFDWYITEKYFNCDDEDPEQHLAYGFVCMFENELGNISIHELIKHGVELDLYFTPTTLGEIKRIKRVHS